MGREDSRAELCSPPLLAERAVVRLEESRKLRRQAQDARRCRLPNEFMVDDRVLVGEDVPEGDDPRRSGISDAVSGSMRLNWLSASPVISN